MSCPQHTSRLMTTRLRASACVSARAPCRTRSVCVTARLGQSARVRRCPQRCVAAPSSSIERGVSTGGPLERAPGGEERGAEVPPAVAVCAEASRLLRERKRTQSVRVLETFLEKDGGKAADAYVYSLLVKAYKSVHRYKDAVKTLDLGLDRHPDSVALRHQRCVHEAHNGSFAAADAMFAELLDLSPRNVRSLHAWAELHRKRGRTARAEELYREALRVDPDHGQSLASLAKLLVDTGTSASARDDARDLLRRALDARPSDTVALQALARLEWAAGNRRAARQIYARIAMLGPAGGDGDGAGGQKDADARGSHAATPSLLSGWGGLEQSRRHSARAARLYEAALQRDPEHLPSLMGLGVVESKAGNHAAAEAHYRRALEVSPGNVRIRCALAQGLRAAGRTAEARRELDGVLEDDPGCARAWYILGVLLQQIGEAGDAREAFKRGAGTGGRDGKPRDATSLLLCFEAWAEGEAGQGRTALAVRLFEEGCIAIAPQEPTARYLRAWALAAKREGDLEGALELLARAARADPHDYRIWLLRAVLQRRSGGVSAARSDYARAAAARPREPAVWLSWSQLERAAGDDARARELLVRGVQRCPGCNPQLLTEIALMDIERGGNVDPARRMLAVASHVQPGAGRGTAQATRQPHVPALTAWHAMEVQRGNAVLAARLEELETAALTGGPRAARHVVQELAQLAATEVGASPESVLRELHRRALGAAAEEDDGGVDDGWQAGLLSSIGGVEDEEGGGVDEGAVRP